MTQAAHNEAMAEAPDNDCCSACGVPWEHHPGIALTCEALGKARAALALPAAPAGAAEAGDARRMREALEKLRDEMRILVASCCGQESGKAMCDSWGCGRFKKFAEDIDDALATPAPATPATARAEACETCAKLPKTRDGVPIVPGMKVWSGKSATLHTVRSVCEGTFVAVCDCHGKELVCVSNDVQAYDEESRPVEFPFDHTVFSTRAAAEAAAASASPGGVATGEGGR
jgi:hypothetical protein